MNRNAKTRDISSGGVCFLSGNEVEVGGRIDYMITLSGSNPPVRIRCLGKVLRSQRPSPRTEGFDAGSDSATDVDTGYEIAVTMERYSFVKSQEFDDAAVFA